MLSKSSFIVMISAFLLAACGSAVVPSTNTQEATMNTPESAKGNLPSLTGEWTISMTHSGGIMGMMRSIEIKSTGDFNVKDARGNKNVTSQLTVDELAALIQTVNSSSFFQNTKPNGCADCFIYNIMITSDGGKFSAQVDDITIEESGLSELVALLRNLIERELK